MMINLELFAQCSDHRVIQICTVVCDDSVWNTIPTYEILLDKAGNHIFGDGGEGSCFDPFSEVVNGNQDEAAGLCCWYQSSFPSLQRWLYAQAPCPTPGRLSAVLKV